MKAVNAKLDMKSDSIEDVVTRKRRLPHLVSLVGHCERLHSMLQLDLQPQSDIAVTLVTTMSLVASIYLYDVDEYSKAKLLLEKTLVLSERLYGQTHVETAKILIELGYAFYLLDLIDLSIDSYERAFDVFVFNIDIAPLDVAKSLQLLGGSIQSRGDDDELKELSQRTHYILERLDKTLSGEENRVGPDHIDLVPLLFHLAMAHGSLGDHETKKRLLERALHIEERHDGSNSIKLVMTLSNLADAYCAVGDIDQQCSALIRAVDITESQHGLDNIDLAPLLYLLGKAQASLNEHTMKKKLLERAIRIEERHLGPDHIDVADTLASLADVYSELGEIEKQRDTLIRALKIREKWLLTPHQMDFVPLLFDLAIANGCLDDHATKKGLLQRALRIEERHHGPDHLDVAMTLSNLGDALGALGEYPTQLEVLERALVINQKSHSSYSEASGTLRRLCQAYASQKDVMNSERVLAMSQQWYCESNDLPTDAISGCLSEKRCTHSVTGAHDMIQYAFECITCGLNDDEVTCLFCSQFCHEGHEIIPLGPQDCYCHCATTDDPSLCRIFQRSPFRNLYATICPQCHYIEFPYCERHNVLLAQQSSVFVNDMICPIADCVDIKESNKNRSCGSCRSSSLHVNCWSISVDEAKYCATSIVHFKESIINHNILLCDSCHVAEFPGSGGGLTVNLHGRMYDPSTKRCLTLDDFNFRHMSKSCAGEVGLVPVLLSKEETLRLYHLIEHSTVDKTCRVEDPSPQPEDFVEYDPNSNIPDEY